MVPRAESTGINAAEMPAAVNRKTVDIGSTDRRAPGCGKPACRRLKQTSLGMLKSKLPASNHKERTCHKEHT